MFVSLAELVSVINIRMVVVRTVVLKINLNLKLLLLTASRQTKKI